MLDTLEDVEWYVTLTILTTSIQEDIRTNNITNLFEQCYIPLMLIHACMQHNYYMVLKYLTLLMLNKCKLENY